MAADDLRDFINPHRSVLLEKEGIRDLFLRSLAPLRELDLSSGGNIRPLGKGGHGMVFEVTVRQSLGTITKFAVKTVVEENGSCPTGVECERLVLEGKVLMVVSEHPCIVKIKAFLVDPPSIVMDCIDGETLRAMIYSKKLHPIKNKDELIQIVKDIAGALLHIHELRVVHSDLKANNVIICGGHAYLIDFGLAVREGSTLRQSLGIRDR